MSLVVHEHSKKMNRQDFVFWIVGLGVLAFSLMTLVALMIDLFSTGWTRITPDFFTSFASRFPEKAGILAAWVGSLIIIVTTAMIAIPLGVATAIYLEEYSTKNKLSRLIELNILNLAGVPSIIYGIMSLGIFVYYFKWGQSIITASLTLALLILPIIIVATRESIRTVPQYIREASYSVGATKWQTIRYHILPYSSGGIMTGVVIALSRAIGETAPLVTVGALSFIAFLPTSPLMTEPPYISEQSYQWLFDPYTVLPIQMFNWVSRPQEEFHINAAAAGAVLLTLTLFLNGLAIFIRYRFRKRYKW